MGYFAGHTPSMAGRPWMVTTISRSVYISAKTTWLSGGIPRFDSEVSLSASAADDIGAARAGDCRQPHEGLRAYISSRGAHDEVATAYLMAGLYFLSPIED